MNVFFVRLPREILLYSMPQKSKPKGSQNEQTHELLHRRPRSHESHDGCGKSSGVNQPAQNPARIGEITRLANQRLCFLRGYARGGFAKKGIDTRKLMAVSVWRETPFFTEQERAALLWAETLTRVAENHVPDEVYQQAMAHFSEKELAELTFVIGIINAWNRFGVAFAAHPK